MIQDFITARMTSSCGLVLAYVLIVVKFYDRVCSW